MFNYLCVGKHLPGFLFDVVQDAEIIAAVFTDGFVDYLRVNL